MDTHEKMPTLQDILGESNLTYKAKGILLHLIEFGYSFEHLEQSGREGADAIRTGIKELKDAGIIAFKPRRSANGQIAFSEVVVTWGTRFGRSDDPIDDEVSIFSRLLGDV